MSKKSLFIIILTVCLFSVTYSQNLWVNEIHYDNDGADIDEGFEIAGTAGTDLTGWTVSLYNGNDSRVYGIVNLVGVIPDEGTGFGALWFNVSGFQNGNSDGLALVAGDGTTVIQFLSYEGTITATNGPAENTTSSDIGVSESPSTTVGSSLQLQGSGCQYSDFTWAVNSLNSRDAINSMQFMTCYVVTYNGNSNTDGTEPIDSNTYSSGGLVTVSGLGDLAKSCYNFNGWNTNADGSGITYWAEDTFTILAPTTLYAQWQFIPNCDLIMISQYYEGSGNNKWVEIKNISGTIIPANSFYLAVYNKGSIEQPLTGVPSKSILIPAMTENEVIRFKESSTTLPAYTNSDGIVSQTMFSNSFSGDDILVISTTNNNDCYSNRVDIIGEYSDWGDRRCFIRNSCIADGPSTTFNINDWVEFSDLEVDTAVPGTNPYLGEHFNGVTDFNGDGTNGWSNGLPEKSRIVTVTANYDTATNGSFDACSLSTTGTVSINIRSGDNITIINDLSVNARGILNVEHEGSLVMVNDSGTVINEGTTNITRNTSTMEQYDYHYWSSPIDYSINTTPIASVLSDFYASRIYEYNTSAFNDANNDGSDDDLNDWVNYSGEMKSGTGYAAMTSSPGIRNTVFSGKVNNGVITVNVQLSTDASDDPGGDEDDWNLLGNPYPSAISADDFITQNNNINGTLYFWTHVDDISITNPGPYGYNYSTDDYAMYSTAGGIASASGSAPPSGYIESGLGFFVDAISAGTVEFNNSMRSKSYANNNSFSATSTNEIIEKDRFWLNLTNPDGAFSQILIGFFEDATLEKDRIYDGIRLTGSNYIDFYSLDNTSFKYGIQGRPAFNDNESIVLGYQSNILGNLSIDLATREGVLLETPIYLIDNYLSITHDLTIAPYSFNTDTGTYNDRFEIAFNPETLSINDIQINPSNLQIIELQNGQVQFKVPSEFQMTSIKIMDLTGKTIYNFSAQGSLQTFSISNLSNTAYLATVQLANGQTITKKAIKKR